MLLVAFLAGCGGATSGSKAPVRSVGTEKAQAVAASAGAEKAGADVPAFDASSQESLTGWARARLAKLLAKPVVVRGPLSLGIEGASVVINLDRVWQVCGTSPDECEASADEFVAGVAQVISGQTDAATPEALRVVVRDRSYLEEAFGAAGRLVSRPIAGDLRLLVVVDGEKATRSLRLDELEGMGLTVDAAFERALANTRTELGEPKPFRIKPGTMAMLQATTYYETSLFALHDLWAPAARAVKGDLLVAVPGVELILFADSTAPDALKRLSEDAAKMSARSQRPISTEVYRFTEAGWEVATPAH